MILFRNVSLSRGKSTTRFAVSPFFRRKVTIFIGRETKTHIFRRKSTKKIGQVSPFINNYSFRMKTPFNTQQQQQQHQQQHHNTPEQQQQRHHHNDTTTTPQRHHNDTTTTTTTTTLLAGDFNVEPTKIPCLSKGISAGLWVDLGCCLV